MGYLKGYLDKGLIGSLGVGSLGMGSLGAGSITGSVLHLYAATHDPVTYELLLCPVGLLVNSQPMATTLSYDKDTIYHEFTTDIIWQDMRVADGKYYADDGSGNLLDPKPQLMSFYGYGNNISLYSNNLTIGTTANGNTITFDQVGLKGEINTASLIVPSSSSDICYKTTSLSNTIAYTHACRLYIKKRNTTTTNILVRLQYVGGTEYFATISVNPKTGDLLIVDGTDFNAEVIVLDTLLIISISLPNIGANDILNIVVGASYYELDSIVENSTTIENLTVLNTEVYESKSIFDVNGIETIITEDTAVSAHRTLLQSEVIFTPTYLPKRFSFNIVPNGTDQKVIEHSNIKVNLANRLDPDKYIMTISGKYTGNTSVNISFSDSSTWGYSGHDDDDDPVTVNDIPSGWVNQSTRTRRPFHVYAGDFNTLTEIEVDYQVIRGVHPDLSLFPNLVTFNVYNNEFSGSIPSSFLTESLVYYDLSDNDFTGDIPSVTNNMDDVELYGNKFTGYAGGWSTGVVSYFDASGNALTEEAVNRILIDANTYGIASGTNIYLNGGTNAAPTGLGLAAKVNLIANGAAVSTN